VYGGLRSVNGSFKKPGNRKKGYRNSEKQRLVLPIVLLHIEELHEKKEGLCWHLLDYYHILASIYVALHVLSI